MAQAPDRDALHRSDATHGVLRRPTAPIALPAILWIDDEVTPGDATVRLLRLEGFQVECAGSGAAGLAMARAGRYDAVLLDLQLPDIPCLDVLDALDAEGTAVPVLVLTGFGDFEAARKAGRRGVARFMAKPAFADELAAALRAAIEDARQHGPPQVRSAASDFARQDPADALDTLFRHLAVLGAGQTLGEAEGYRFGESEPAPVAGPTAPLVWLMARALVSNLPAAVFLSCAEALREAMPPVTGRTADLAICARGALVRASRLAALPRSSHMEGP